MKNIMNPVKIAFYISILGVSVSGIVMLASRFDDVSIMIFFCNMAFFFSMLAYMNLKKTEQNENEQKDAYWNDERR